jgi:5-methyltetrahydropteroyltriglutamate--homocysteine methyltransferase
MATIADTTTATRAAATPRPPFRADHVGSLLRPKSLLVAREDYARGAITGDQLRQIENDAIRDAVRMQEDIGLQGVTDGEMRRGSWHMDFLYQIGGVTKAQDSAQITFNNAAGGTQFTPAALRVTGKLQLTHTIFGEDFLFLKSVAKAMPKLTIPAPSLINYRGGRAAIDEDVYPDMDAFWHDVGEVFADEVKALGALGCTYLQIDDTSLAYLNDPKQREYITQMGGSGDRQHLTYIESFNAAVSKKPADMVVCTHMCRGNFRSSWVASGGYDYVAEALFTQLKVDGFFLEYDDERSGGFAPLRFVPKDKYVVLGLVTSKRGELETKDDLKRRLDEASKFIPLDQLCLSPQCGFSSTVDGNSVTVEQQMAKLRLVVETAREVWG